MRSELREKRMVVASARYRYQRAIKKEKSTMVDHLSMEHRYNCSYAARLLRGGQRASNPRTPDGRGRLVYYPQVYSVLKRR